jgi:hypothetical protein
VLSHLSSASLPILPLCRALADHPGHLVPEMAAQAGCLVHRRLVSPAAATHHVVALARLPSHDPPMWRNLSYGCLAFCALAAHDGERTPVQEGISRTAAPITSAACVFRVYVPVVGVTDRDPYDPGRPLGTSSGADIRTGLWPQWSDGGQSWHVPLSGIRTPPVRSLCAGYRPGARLAPVLGWVRRGRGPVRG